MSSALDDWEELKADTNKPQSNFFYPAGEKLAAELAEARKVLAWYDTMGYKHMGKNNKAREYFKKYPSKKS